MEYVAIIITALTLAFGYSKAENRKTVTEYRLNKTITQGRVTGIYDPDKFKGTNTIAVRGLRDDGSEGWRIVEIDRYDHYNIGDYWTQ